MYKIGVFALINCTTKRALRYYEKEGLLIPKLFDGKCRYYDDDQFETISKIISLKQVGMSIDDIKSVIDGADESVVLLNRKKQIEENMHKEKTQLDNIEFLLKVNKKKYEITIKKVPKINVIVFEDIINGYKKTRQFVNKARFEFIKLNPKAKNPLHPYCYVTFNEDEKSNDSIKAKYVQLVEDKIKESETIKAREEVAVLVASTYCEANKECYFEAYKEILIFIKMNNYQKVGEVRFVNINEGSEKGEQSNLIEIQLPIRLLDNYRGGDEYEGSE